MKIRDVRAIAAGGAGADYHRQTGRHWINDLPVASPMSLYEPYKAQRTSWGIDALGTVVVEVELDNGLKGVGCSLGGPPAAFLIERHLSRFVTGQDPRNVELIWDQMWRATLPYGRKGLAIHALSAVDLALWDCLGKLRGEPVWALLGGKTKSKLPLYATTARADIARSLGFHGVKIPCRYGPADGSEGMRRNVAAVAEAREQIGRDLPLRLDCYMSLTVPYAIELARACEPYQLDWIEECLPPDDYDGYATLKREIKSCRIATGEHEYTRYGFRELITRGCADILQPDINWCGGMTEARRIVALAAAFDLPVIPHGSSVFSYHLQLAFPNCPVGEFLMMAPEADRIVPIFGSLFRGEPLPENGYVDVGDAPGWGLELLGS